MVGQPHVPKVLRMLQPDLLWLHHMRKPRFDNHENGVDAGDVALALIRFQPSEIEIVHNAIKLHFVPPRCTNSQH